MAKHYRDPSIEFHEQWVDKLVADSPSPLKRQKFDENGLLMSCESSTEHVLRGSKSFAVRSFRSRAPLSNLHLPLGKLNNENASVSADSTFEHTLKLANSQPPVLGEIANNGQLMRPVGPWRLRRSPTPSIRKKKVEALVKHHGSPQHIRVTAGGRIVPSEQSPLCHPRFGYSAIKTNGGLVKVVPNHKNSAAQWTQATQDGFIAQDVDGRLCQIVNGTIMPLQEQDGMLRLYISAPNLNITQQRGTSFAAPTPLEHVPVPAQDQPSIAAQKNALELEYSKLDHELKDLDRTEVLHGRSMGKVAKDALIAKRRELVIGMDRTRKALKSLNDLPQNFQLPSQDARVTSQDARAHMPPTSPKAMRATSPQGRLPPFLNRFRQSSSVTGPPPPPPHMAMGNFGHPFYAPPQPVGSHAYSTALMPDGPMPPFQLPQPAAAGLYMQPPPFDGEMAPLSTYQAGPKSADGDKSNIPQADGSHSFKEQKKTGVASPNRHSHALPIKDPETKQVAAVKSTLNPMSPVYKPAATSNGVATKVSGAAAQSANSCSSAVQQANPTVATTPGKKSKRVVVQSSSVSSIKTADFFPRNTREYSMRKHEYPTTTDSSEDKENADPEADADLTSHDYTDNTRYRSQSPSPVTPKRGLLLHNSNWNPEIPDGAFPRFASPPQTDSCNPTAPPGTPVDGNWTHRSITENALPDRALSDHVLPDRSTHNLSPKSKRQTWHFIQEHPSQYGSEDVDIASSPMKERGRREELCVTESPLKDNSTPEELDLRNKSSTWIEGFQAGLYRRAVGADKMGEFLAGYCAGLMKSEVVTSVSTGIGMSNGSGSPAKGTRSVPKAIVARPPFETSVQSMDTLKQAIFAPQNENAVLTPVINGPHVNEAPMHLGAWQKRHPNIAGSGKDAPASYPFPQRNSSLAENPLQDSTLSHLEQRVSSPSVSKQNDPSQLPSERLTSITSIDSTLYRPWSHRVISPFEWKSQSSVSHAAELATGYFAHGQYDGTAPDPTDERAGMLTHAAGFAGAPSHGHNNGGMPAKPTAVSATTAVQPAELYTRFREASLDGMSSSPVTSPPMSPRISPARFGMKKHHSPMKSADESAGKGSSPAKAKFADIAGRVGIKVSAEKKDVASVGAPSTGPSTRSHVVGSHVAGTTPSSPPGKKRWRDIWHGSRKDGGT